MPTSTGTYDTSTITYDQSSLSYDGFPVPLANMPAVGVFIAWTDTPYTVSPGWTEISQYVRQITIRRGRQDDLQQFPPGAAQLVLDNRDRLFDPFNTAGANYANLKPRKQIKIVANWNGTEYPLYRGYVAGWPVEYTEGGLDSTVTIDCFDLLGLIGASTINRNFFDEYTLSLGPTRYYPFSERPDNNQFFDLVTETAYIYETGTTIITPGGGGTSLPWTTSSMRQGNPMLPGLETPSVFSVFDSALLYDSGRTTSASGSGQDCTVSFVAQLNERSYLFNFTFGNFRILVNSSRQVNADSTSGTYITLPSPTIDDNKPHLFTFTFNNTTDTLRCYVDGKQTGFVTTAGAGLFVWPLVEAKFEWFGLTQLQNFTTFQRELTATEVQTLYQAAMGQFAQNTSERFVEYAGYANMPAGFYNVSSAVATQVLDLEPEASPVLPELQKLVTGEGGNLFVSRSGVLQFYGRDSVFNETRSNTSQVTFTDTGVGVEYDASVVRLDLNADQVRNQVTVRGSNSSEVTVVSTDSVTQNGQAADSLDTYLIDPTAANALAERFVTVYENPKMTVEPFMSKGQADPSYNWPRLLGLELLDRVTFKRTPATGSAIVKDLLVQSIEHRVTPGTWETVVNGSARYTNWFIVGVSLIGGDDLLLN